MFYDILCVFKSVYSSGKDVLALNPRKCNNKKHDIHMIGPCARTSIRMLGKSLTSVEVQAHVQPVLHTGTDQKYEEADSWSSVIKNMSHTPSIGEIFNRKRNAKSFRIVKPKYAEYLKQTERNGKNLK